MRYCSSSDLIITNTSLSSVFCSYTASVRFKTEFITFMSRSMSDTSLGSAFRNIKLAIFFFYSFFLCSLVLCMWKVVRFVSSSASQRVTLSYRSEIWSLPFGKASSGCSGEASAVLKAGTFPPFIDAQKGAEIFKPVPV